MREFPCEDRDEDDIVNAEHEFEHGECQKRDPHLRVCQPFHSVANSCLSVETCTGTIYAKRPLWLIDVASNAGGSVLRGSLPGALS